MPFKEVSVDQLRREFVVLAMKEGANRRALCRQFGISPTHGYALIKRAQDHGLACLDRQSRRPHASPRQLSAEREAEIVEVRLQHPDWGARKIGRWLRDRGRDAPADSTITTVLRRNGLITPPPGGYTGTFQRFQRPHPNDLWQMDFLGHKPLRTGRVHPLTILDDHSRYGLTLTACANETSDTVWTHLHRCLQLYGLPHAILTDNGSPWGHTEAPITRLGVRLMQHGVQLIHGRPWHPQTQGKIERWHRTITRAVFGPIPFVDLAQTQTAFDAFLVSYNHERPHQALDMDCPIQHFSASLRPYPSRILPPEYDDGVEVRKVRQSGEIMYHNRRLKVSASLAGEYVAVQPTADDGVIEISYYTFRLRSIDLRAEVDV